MIFRRAVYLAALMMLIARPAFSDDCVMGRYDPTQSGFTQEKLQLPLALNWEFAGNKYDHNPVAPVVADGTCYFACSDRVYAVDLATGNLKWRYPSDRGLGGSVKSSLALYKGNVYLGVGDGNLYCLSADTGTFRWAYQTRGAIRCPPVITDDGVLYVGTDDSNLYAIDAISGEGNVWDRTFAAKDDIAVGIAVGSGMILAASMDGGVYGVTATSGKLRWPPFRMTSAPTRSSPLISDNIAIMASSNMMYGLTTRSGQMRWSVTLSGEIAATPALAGTDLFVPCRDKKLYAYSLSGRTPVLKWTAPATLDGMPLSSPTVANDTVYVTCSKGVVEAFAVSDGALKWRYLISPSQVNAAGAEYTDASSSPIVAEGCLLVLTDDGVLHCFSPNAPDCSAPVPFKVTPDNGTVLSGAPPINMSAILYDIGSGVDFSTVSLTLDGTQSLDYKVDFAKSTVSYATEVAAAGKPQKADLADGNHTLTLTAKDYAGNLLTKKWYFITDSSLPPPKKAKKDTDEGKKTTDKTDKSHRSLRHPPLSMPGMGAMPGAEAPPPPPPPAPAPPEPAPAPATAPAP